MCPQSLTTQQGLGHCIGTHRLLATDQCQCGIGILTVSGAHCRGGLLLTQTAGDRHPPARERRDGRLCVRCGHFRPLRSADESAAGRLAPLPLSVPQARAARRRRCAGPRLALARHYSFPCSSERPSGCRSSERRLLCRTGRPNFRCLCRRRCGKWATAALCSPRHFRLTTCISWLCGMVLMPQCASVFAATRRKSFVAETCLSEQARAGHSSTPLISTLPAGEGLALWLSARCPQVAGGSSAILPRVRASVHTT